MTVNQALDKLLSKESLTKEQKELRDALQRFKMYKGGRTKLKDADQIKKVIES